MHTFLAVLNSIALGQLERKCTYIVSRLKESLFFASTKCYYFLSLRLLKYRTDSCVLCMVSENFCIPVFYLSLSLSFPFQSFNPFICMFQGSSSFFFNFLILITLSALAHSIILSDFFNRSY